MQLGIDFGTCYTSAAIMLDGVLQLVKDPIKKDYSIPSSVYLVSENNLLFGYSAEFQRKKDPNRYRSQFKRDLGKDTPLQLGECQLMPEELIAEVLGKIKKEADSIVTVKGHQPLSNTVITVPATYTDYKRQLMLKAAESAGFETITFLAEPVATAINCAKYYQIQDGEIILVYDLGGGTFDATLMQKQQENSYNFLAMPVGDSQCGGIDFDRKIYQDFKNNASQELQNILNQNTKEAILTRSLLGEACRELKHQLSEADEAETSIIVPGSGELEYYQLKREKFNSLISSYLQKSIQLCEQLVKDAELSWEKVDRVLMVGGSCRIPYIKQLLEQQWKRPVFLVDDPDLAVCQGAAIFGAKRAERKSGSGEKKEHRQEERQQEFQREQQEKNDSLQQAQYYYKQGLEKWKIKNYNLAIEDFTQAIQFSSIYAEAYYARGMMHLQLSNKKGATEDLETAAKLFLNQEKTADYEKVLKKIEEIIQPSSPPPSQPEEYPYQKGLKLLQQEKFQEAIPYFNQVLSQDSRHAQAYFMCGFAYFRLENYQNAQTDCDQAIQCNDKLSDAYVLRGFSYFCQNNYHTAIQNFNQALQIKRDHSGAFLGQSLAYACLRNNKKAFEDFKQVKNLMFDFNANEFNQILAAVAQGNKPKVTHYLQKNAHLFLPELVNTWNKLNKNELEFTPPQSPESKPPEPPTLPPEIPTLTSDSYQQGLENFKQGKYLEAVVNFDEVLRQNSSNSEAYFYRGLACFCLEGYQKTRDNCDQAIQYNDKFSDAYVLRGLSYFCQNNYQPALQNFNQALQINSNNSNAFLGRSLAYVCLKNHSKALTDINQVKRISVNFNANEYNKILAVINCGNQPEVIKYLQKNARFFLFLQNEVSESSSLPEVELEPIINAKDQEYLNNKIQFLRGAGFECNENINYNEWNFRCVAQGNKSLLMMPTRVMFVFAEFSKIEMNELRRFAVSSMSHCRQLRGSGLNLKALVCYPVALTKTIDSPTLLAITNELPSIDMYTDGLNSNMTFPVIVTMEDRKVYFSQKNQLLGVAIWPGVRKIAQEMLM